MGGRRSYAVALAAGGLLSLAFPEPSVAPLAWVTIAPLLLVLRGVPAGRGFRLGFTFGLGFFGLLLSWISIVGYAGFIVLVLLQACFIGAFGALVGPATRDGSAWVRVVLPAAFWVVLVEYARSVVPTIGFTWGELAQSQHNVPWLLKTAGLAGGWGTAFLLLCVNGLVVEVATLVGAGRRSSALKASAAALALLAAPALIPTPSADGDPIEVAIVQGNIPREMEPSYEKDLLILENHIRLTEQLPESVDLVVWPESSVGIDLERELDVGLQIADVARSIGKPMLIGGNSEREDGRYQVMAFLVSPDGRIVDRYQKTHLVPFGEYVPARDLLDWIPALDQVPRDAAPGSEETLFDLDGNLVAPVISFEGDFGSLVRSRIGKGGRLLVVATNTSTWNDAWTSAQHVAMSQVRAAESGVYVVHGALTGISAFIAPSGEVIESTELWTGTSIVQEVRFATSITPYARMGDWFPLFCLVGAASLRYLRRRRPDVTVL